MRGKTRDNKDAVRSFIRRHGSNYTYEQVARLFGVPVKTIRTWYWEVDCVAQNAENGGHAPHDLGVAVLLARAPLTAAGAICRHHNRQRRACNRALGIA